ncbi:oxidoreductase short chain dehydrogenase/reductase family superfamily [Penicillium coprophilum]|uniref:oxidoreductase short chain dehydrogenase/reductase family superfamily n=1 Tax=Penicillium coprophilum TaxID=36646 RepID=UPI00238F279A|nr:oxidoreductase short chain dehydrogenase/reductase family superfamily [Penicillium coprophilum]KAJ5162744.1 oxidoreductase short chain dehydrogenase/reductase family superfamily [Penicillium coprophilum]
MATKVIVVTGSASGMGLATATRLASSGVHLALWDINSSKLEEIAKSFKSQYSGKILAQTVDVSDRSAVKAALIEAQNSIGAINGIANFAGTGGRQLGVEPIWETSPEEFDFIINLNIKGLFNLLGEALTPGFLGDLKSVVHISSMFSTRGYQNGAVFAASKHAALGMVKSAALEVGSRGIRVNCVLPGAIETPMFHEVIDNAGLSSSASNTPIPRPGQPEEVASVTKFLLGDQSSYVTGAAWNVDGGANA